MCQVFIDPSVKDISPLLRHYDLMSENLNVQIKARHLYELD